MNVSSLPDGGLGGSALNCTRRRYNPVARIDVERVRQAIRYLRGADAR